MKDLPRFSLVPVFARLRQIAMDDGATNRSLSEELGVFPSNMSRWASGADGREPSLEVVRWMANRVGRAVVILPDRVLIIPLEAAKLLTGYDGTSGLA